MDKSLLHQLYDGEFYPSEAIRCDTSEYRALNGKISDETEYFMSILSPDDWERFEQLDDMKLERTSAYTFENFAYGFRIGAALMIEVFFSGEK